MSDAGDGFGKVSGGAFGNADARGRKASGGSEILDAGQLLIAGMRLTTGWGRPDPGEAFGHGAVGFTGAGQTVDSAYPRDEWAGTGSRTYASANRRQSGSAETLAVLDRDVQTVVAREAFQVDYHRGKLDDQSDHLSTLSYATWALALIPGVGTALKAAVEMTAVNTALMISSTELASLASETGDNAAELRRLAEGYSALTRKTAPLTDQPPPGADEQERSDDEERRPVAEMPTDEPPRLDAKPVPALGEASVATAAPVPVPPPVHCAPAAEAPTAGQALPPPVAAADPMTGMSAVFGAVGGAIGSAVAPIAAVLTGVVSAAAQALSTAAPAQSAESTDAAPDAETATTDKDPNHGPVQPASDEDDEPTTSAATAEPDAPVTAPPPVAEPPRPPAPAATRPPL